MPAPPSSDETKARLEQAEETRATRATPPAEAAGTSRKRARESPGDGDGPSTEPSEHQQPSLEAEVECEEELSRTATGASPTPRDEGKEEDDDCTVIGETICHVLSDSDADDSVQDPEDGQRELAASSGAGNGGNKERHGDASDRCFVCTACRTQMFSASEVHEHPTLHGVGICGDCFDFVFTAPFTRDEKDGSEEQCRWCGEAREGGVVALCDTCDKMFCYNYIVLNYDSRQGLAQILISSTWSCFCCNPEPLRIHVDRLKEFLRSVPPGINSSVRQGNAGISTVPRGQSVGNRDRPRVRSSDAGRRASDLNPGNQGEVATTAELMAQTKEMIAKHQEAAERRAQDEAECYKRFITNVQTDLKHRESIRAVFRNSR